MPADKHAQVEDSASSSKAKKKQEKKDAHDVASHVTEKELHTVPPVPISHRKCTDVLCLVLIITYWTTALVVAAVGFKQGNPERLVYGSDYQGRTCGGASLPNRTLVTYPRVAEDIIQQVGLTGNIPDPTALSFYGVCVSSCPKEGDFVCNDLGDTLVGNATAAHGTTRDYEIGECVNNLPFPYPSCYDARIATNCWFTLFNMTSVLTQCMPQYTYTVQELPSSGCARYTYSHNWFTNTTTKSCIAYTTVTLTTQTQPTATDILYDSFNTVSINFSRYVADAIKAWPVILICGVGLTAITGLAYIASMFYFVRLIVWLTVVLVQSFAVVFTVILYIKGGAVTVPYLTAQAQQAASDVTNIVNTQTGAQLLLADPQGNSSIVGNLITSGSALASGVTVSQNYQQQFLISAYVMTAVTIILLLLIIMLGPRIRRAIEVFEQAAAAVRSNPGLILLPLISVPLQLGLFVFWAVITAYLASCGSYNLQLTSSKLNISESIDPTQNFTVATFQTFDYMEVFIAFEFLGYLWTANFASGIFIYIVAGTVGSWYFAGSPDQEKSPHGWNMLRATYVVLRFHLGSIAIGALLVSIIQFVRYVSAYLEARSQELKSSRIARAIACMIQCCLTCLSWCISFVSRNAYIYQALYGDSFCESASHSFATVLVNIASVATVTFLGDVIVRFGQILITMVASFACYMYLTQNSEYQVGGALELNSFFFPTLLTAMLSWFLAGESLAIYDLASDTLLLAFCVDAKLAKFKKTGGKTLKASASYKGFMTKHSAKDILEDGEGGDATGRARRSSVASAIEGASANHA